MRVYLIKILLRCFAYLPLPLVHFVGAVLGWIVAVVQNSVRHISAINIGLCLPQLSQAEQKRLVRASLIESGKTAFEFAPIWLRDREYVLSLIREVHGEHHLYEALNQGRGAIVATPHLGSWELAGLYCSTRNTMTTLYRPPRMSEFDDTVRSARERFGARLVATDKHGIRVLVKTLREGKLVGMLPDQEPASGAGVFASFLGVPAYTMVLLSRLAHSTGAAVVFTYAERLPRGKGYRLFFKTAPPAIADADPAVAAQCLNDCITEDIKKLPSQYQWSYKRFRTRPQGSDPLY